MPEQWNGSRRSVLAFAVGLLLDEAAGPHFACGLGSAIPEFVSRPPIDSAKSKCCRYRVNATVILACVPVFSRQGVGDAYVAFEESVGRTCTVTRLQFAAGSWPDRLKGFNRFGATQEAVKEENGVVIESSYLSFMTGGYEKDSKEALKTFGTSSESLSLTIGRGRSSPSGITSNIVHRTVPATCSWSNCPDLTGRLDFLPLPPERPVPECIDRALPTFLFAVRRALLSRSEASAGQYTHNGKVYRLRTRKKTDLRSNELVMTGRISASEERSETEFKLWLSPRDRAALPKRVEFRPKNFLKLALEADETQSGPVRPLFKQEQ